MIIVPLPRGLLEVSGHHRNFRYCCSNMIRRIVRPVNCERSTDKRNRYNVRAQSHRMGFGSRVARADAVQRPARDALPYDLWGPSTGGDISASPRDVSRPPDLYRIGETTNLVTGATDFGTQERRGTVRIAQVRIPYGRCLLCAVRSYSLPAHWRLRGWTARRRQRAARYRCIPVDASV